MVVLLKHWRLESKQEGTAGGLSESNSHRLHTEPYAGLEGAFDESVFLQSEFDHNSMPHKRQRRRDALAPDMPREYTACMPNASAPHADHRLQRPGAPKLLFAFLVACYSLTFSETRGQFGIELPGELTETIRLNEPDPAVRTQLERVRVHLAERQWDEAIESLRQIMENHGERMVRLDDRRFIPLREYCHVLLRELPPEGLAIYRGRVDAQASEWLKEGLRRRSRSQLQRVVDELFGSSHADDALFALGEIALERGEFGAARGYWERISPKLRADAATPLWLQRREYIAARQKRNGDETRGSVQAAAWLAYPDTNLDLADVRRDSC